MPQLIYVANVYASLYLYASVLPATHKCIPYSYNTKVALIKWNCLSFAAVATIAVGVAKNAVETWLICVRTFSLIKLTIVLLGGDKNDDDNDDNDFG